MSVATTSVQPYATSNQCTDAQNVSHLNTPISVYSTSTENLSEDFFPVSNLSLYI